MIVPGSAGPRARVARLIATLAATLLALAITAGPALAGGAPGGGTGPGVNPGGSMTGCSGVACYANVWRYITLSGTPGAVSTGGGSGPQVNLPPPPCYMEPMFGGPELYRLWKSGTQTKVGPGGVNPEFPFAAYVPRIKQHKGDAGGYWWERVTNLQVGGACGLPLLAWVTNGAPPPLPAVPAVDLADYAYDHMTLPSPRLTLNPAVRSYVSLPTYVWDTLPFTAAHVTATLGNESATVNATAGNLALAAGGARATVYSNGCTPRGSRSVDPPANAGPGTTPDCGVTFNAPSAGGSITGKISWTATSGARTFQPIVVQGGDTVPVDEIQSLNG